MADADSWDQEGFEVKPIVGEDSFGETVDDWEQVLEKLENEDDAAKTSASTSAEQPAATVPKKKEKKVKSKSNEPVEQAEPHKQLSRAEQEALSRASDMEFFTSTTLGGMTNGDPQDAAWVPLDLSSEDAAKTSALAVYERLQTNKSVGANYTNFLSKLFESLCLDLDSDAVKRLGREVTAIGAEKFKMEKEEKAKQAKGKKKQTMKVTKDASLYDDFLGAEDAAAVGDVSDEDFI